MIEEYLNNNKIEYDLDMMKRLYVNSYTDEECDITKISPLPIVNKNNDYTELGEEVIRNNQYGIVLLAGGNASRLGVDIPKGCFKLHIHDKEISIFETYINQLKETYNKYNIYINLYIMTNDENNDEIVKFFGNNNYFNYPKDKIHFFVQDNLPILDTDGNLLLKDKDTLLVGPNGNGNVFKALDKSNLLNNMITNNIKYVLFVTIDNVMNKLVDINMLGNMINGNYPVATKTISKKDENEKDWIFCKYDNKPSMLQTDYITNDITNTKVNDDYVYREKNITYHIIEISEIEKYSKINLKYHRNWKRYNYMDETGNIVIPDNNNVFKFEQYIFDAFSYSDNMLLYRVNDDEFKPIKNEDDIQIVENILNKKDA